ncbi:hypothetical protein N181_02270 [Sinorhizobium fredii USDA 205]|nr:hypothetical protein N181_02270 [Sinorhizobium fredii USDA 205]
MFWSPVSPVEKDSTPRQKLHIICANCRKNVQLRAGITSMLPRLGASEGIRCDFLGSCAQLTHFAAFAPPPSDADVGGPSGKEMQDIQQNQRGGE